MSRNRRKRWKGKQGRDTPLRLTCLLTRGDSGEMFYEIIIKTLIVVVFLLTVINLYHVFIQYQNVNYICRRVVRAIEVEGAYTSGVTATFNALKSQLNLPAATMEISSVSYFDASTRKIQLRDHFTITIRSAYSMTILNPIFAPPLVIPIQLTSTLTGMSEVYHKP